MLTYAYALVKTSLYVYVVLLCVMSLYEDVHSTRVTT